MRYEKTWVKRCFIRKRFKGKKEKIVYLPGLKREYVVVDDRTFRLCCQKIGAVCVPYKETNNGKVKILWGILASQKHR